MRSVVSFGMNPNGSSFVLRLSPGDLRVGDLAPEKVLGMGLSGTGYFGFFTVFFSTGESSDSMLLLLFSLFSLSSEESELPRILLLLLDFDDLEDLDEFEDFDERLDFEESESEFELTSSLSLVFFLTPGLDACDSDFGFSESVSSRGLTRLP